MSVFERIQFKALLSRRVEEALLELFSQGKLFGTLHTCIGQEFSGAVISELLLEGDAVFSNHRGHGHYLSMRQNVEGLIGELMGKSNGVCGGLGGSQHLYDKNFYSNGIQGGIVPVAAGLALARKIRKQKNIAIVFIGDGTLGEGVVYETMNIAAKWKLPLLFVLENNLYAQSTSQSQTLSGSIVKRAEAFGIETCLQNTWNWQELYEASRKMVQSMRDDGGPRFLQIDTYRLSAHSKGDDDRDRSEVSTYEARDPLRLISQDQSQPLWPNWESEIQLTIRNAIQASEKAPLASSDRWPAFDAPYEELQWSQFELPRRRFIEALNAGFHRLFAHTSDLIFLGEDIESPYGGAFKATAGLSTKYSERVFNTPISEAAITGVGAGLALEGFRPIVEIMFGDFVGLSFDQLVNHAAKFSFMYDRKVKTNLVLRTPMGGQRGYGPTHSQTLDRHFLGTPGLRVLATNTFINPEEIYQKLTQKDFGPTLVIENKQQYSQHLIQEMSPGFVRWKSSEDFPTVWIEALADTVDLTLIGYGGIGSLLFELAPKLFSEADLICQILVPTQIYPLNVDRYSAIVSKTNNVVFIEEGQSFANFSSEFIAQLSEGRLGRPLQVLRIGPKATGIPSSGLLEKQALPNLQSAFDQITSFVRERGL